MKWLDPRRVPREPWKRLAWFCAWCVLPGIALFWLLWWNWERNVLAVDAATATRLLGYSLVVAILLPEVFILMIIQWKQLPESTPSGNVQGSRTWRQPLLWIVLPWLLCSTAVFVVLWWNLRLNILLPSAHAGRRGFGYALPVLFLIILSVWVLVSGLRLESHSYPPNEDDVPPAL